MPTVQVGAIKVYYELRGSGPRLLYISGTGSDLRWRPNAFDRPVAKEFTVLAYDQRGLGQTDRPEGPYAMADYATDANGLLDAVGWDACLVMGVSFGGMVAQELAIRFPSRVQRVVLACSSSGGAGGASYPLHKEIGLDPLDKARRSISRTDTRRDAAWQAAHPEEVKVLIDQSLGRARVGAGEPGRDLGARLQLEARGGHNTYDRLPTLKMPVLVCGGKYDDIAPVDNQRAIARQVSHARLEFFEGGHVFLDQDPKAFQRIITFLKAAEA